MNNSVASMLGYKQLCCECEEWTEDSCENCGQFVCEDCMDMHEYEHGHDDDEAD